MSAPRLSVALTRDVSPCKGCVRDVEKPQCHDWCWAYLDVAGREKTERSGSESLRGKPLQQEILKGDNTWRQSHSIPAPLETRGNL